MKETSRALSSVQGQGTQDKVNKIISRKSSGIQFYLLLNKHLNNFYRYSTCFLTISKMLGYLIISWENNNCNITFTLLHQTKVTKRESYVVFLFSYQKTVNIKDSRNIYISRILGKYCVLWNCYTLYSRVRGCRG